MNNVSKLIFVGVISSIHGIKGHVIVKSFTNPAVNICKLPTLTHQHQKIVLKLMKESSKGLLCQINNCNTRTDAEKFRGYQLFCLRSSLPQLHENEFYIEDLKNLPVVNKKLQSIGYIEDAMNFGAGDILEIKFNNGKKELFGFVNNTFPVVNDKYVMIADTVTTAKVK